MHCTHCGKELEESASFCSGCGTRAGAEAEPQSADKVVTINTWLVPSILAAVFCCIPLGIIAIVYAARANSAVGSGNYQLAQECAGKAKIWFWIAFVSGFILTFLCLIVQILGAVFSN